MKKDNKRGVTLLQGRKAQITVFMIIGIVLLFSSALLFYIRGQIVEGIPDEFVPTLQEVPLAAQPIKVFVEDCIKRIASEALVQIGLHGGYIDPNDRNLSEKSFLVGLYPTDSDGLKLFDSNKALLPYWWYLKSSNTCSGSCEFASHRPALRKGTGVSIEGQIDKYVERNLGKCLNDFKTFKDRGFTIAAGKMTSEAKVAEKEVLVLLKYPVTATQQGRKTEIEQFFTKIKLNFKEVYNFATDITNSEIEMFFLELHTMNLISSYSWPASIKKIPPIADFTLDIGDHKMWTRIETQKKIESNVLTVGIPMMQVDQSKGFSRRILIHKNKKGDYEYDTIGQGLMDSTIVILNSSKNYTTLEATFTYLDWWPIYLNINNQEVLAPRSGQSSDLMSFFGFNEYRFWYDISFPVLVTIRDPAAFEGTGYSFRFAMEANIRDNNHTTPTYTNLATDSGKKLACNLNQRNTENITITTEDALTGGPAPARVDFVLGNEACFIGFTKADANNKTVLNARFPVGWGALRVNNQSYLLSQERFITSVNKSANKTVKLMRYKYINASVFAKGLSYDVLSKKYVLPPSAAPSALYPQRESALITFKRMNNDSLSGFTTFLSAQNSTSMQLLKLVPGTYEVRGFLFYQSNSSPMRIPKESFTFEVMFSDDVTIDFNETVMDPYPKGGISFNSKTGFLTISNDDLFKSNRVVFYLLRFPPPATHSETLKNAAGIEQVGKVDEYSMLYKTELEPDWLT